MIGPDRLLLTDQRSFVLGALRTQAAPQGRTTGAQVEARHPSPDPRRAETEVAPDTGARSQIGPGRGRDARRIHRRHPLPPVVGLVPVGPQRDLAQPAGPVEAAVDAVGDGRLDIRITDRAVERIGGTVGRVEDRQPRPADPPAIADPKPHPGARVPVEADAGKEPRLVAVQRLAEGKQNILADPLAAKPPETPNFPRRCCSETQAEPTRCTREIRRVSSSGIVDSGSSKRITV